MGTSDHQQHGAPVRADQTVTAHLWRDERGAYAILFALLVTILVGIVAIVIDIGLLRSDRRIDKSATDAAAIAGATKLGEGLPADPHAACLAAVGFLQQNLPGTSGDLSTLCNAFPAPGQQNYNSCPLTALTGTGTLSGNGGTYRINITWPVLDTSPLMLPDIRPTSAAVSQPVVQADGTPCARFGVEISHTRSTLFAGIFGDNSGDTSNHSVALIEIGTGTGGIAAPLVILDPHACNALEAAGGGGSGGGVQIQSFGNVPGVIAVNSDGSQCNGQGTVINSTAQSGQQSRIWAYDSTVSKAAILSYAVAQGQADAYNPAQVTCTSSATPTGPLCPRPTALFAQVNRTSFIDNAYNCDVVNGNCPAANNGIGELRSYARSSLATLNATSAPSLDYTVVSGSSCKTTSGALLYSGNVYVDCTASNGGFVVSGGSVTFNGASVVFAGDLSISGTGSVDFTGPSVMIAGNVSVGSNGNNKSATGGCLLFNVVNASVSAACTNPSESLVTNEPKNGPVVFLGGQLQVSTANASFVAPQTFIMEGDCSFLGSCPAGPVQLSSAPSLSMIAGTSGNLLWSAPLGPATECVPGSVSASPSSACFTNLALWNEYAAPPNGPDVINGGAALILQGTFFTPNAAFKLGGGSNTDIENAQFITGTLNTVGGAVLTMHPNAALTNPPPLITAGLIR